MWSYMSSKIYILKPTIEMLSKIISQNLNFYVAGSRPISTTNKQCEEIIDTLKSNPYYEKYSQKILQLQKDNPDEIASRWKLREDATKPLPCPNKEEINSVDPVLSKKRPTNDHSSRKTYHLNEIMKIELIKDKTTAEIEQIWTEFHRKLDCSLCSVIPSNKYSMIEVKSAKHPLFMLAAPKENGFEYFMVEFSGNTVHFTTVAKYKELNSDSPSVVSLVFYPEFQQDKEIVLMKGEFDTKFVDAVMAKYLVYQMLLYYGDNDENKSHLMETFTNDPRNFEYLKLIEEITPHPSSM